MGLNKSLKYRWKVLLGANREIYEYDFYEIWRQAYSNVTV